jgi:hypothetical protein
MSRRNLAPLLSVLATFIISRVVLFLLGVRFDSTTLTHHWQYLDIYLLRDQLAQSLWHLHSQPPLFNLYLGLWLKLLAGTTGSFAVTFLLLGLFLSCGIYWLMLGLGVRRWLAAGLTILFVLSPTSILYENWLHYTYPLMALLVLAALLLRRYSSDGRVLTGSAFFATLAAVCLTMSFFHLVWLVLVLLGLVILMAAARLDVRRALLAALVPLLVVVGWYGKNLALFQQFTSSTWFGMNLARSTTNFVPMADRQQLVSSGKLYGVSLLPPFSSLKAYEPYVPAEPLTGTPCLDQTERFDGAPNFNNRRYIEISRRYLKDDLYLLQNRPAAYLRSLLDSWLLYFMPASANNQVRDNIEHIRAWTIGYELLQMRFRFWITPELQRSDMARFYVEKVLNMGFIILLSYVAVLIVCIRAIGSGLRRPDKSSLPQVAVLAFIAFNLGYVALTGNSLECGENPRFRAMVDPLLVCGIGFGVEQWLGYRRRPGRSVEQ